MGYSTKLDKKFFQTMAIPPRLTPSQWCESNIYLPASISAKPGRLRLNKMWRGIIDYIWTSPANYHAIQSSAQNSKTTALLACILYSLFAKDVPSLICSPTDELSENLLNRRLKPIIEASPNLKKLYNRDKGFKSQDEVFSHNGTSIKLASAGSVSSLSSIAVSTAIADEVDKKQFGYSGGSDAGPLDLIRTRATTFLNSGAKIIYASTPTTEDGSNIAAMVRMSTKHEFQVACPACKKHFTPNDQQLEWNKQAPLSDIESGKETITLKCPNCEHKITERDFRILASEGEWMIPEGQEDRSPNFHAYVMNGVLAEMQTWKYMVTELIRGAKNPSALQRYTNEIAGRTWTEAKIEYKPEAFRECITDLQEGIIPEDAIALYTACDVGWKDAGEDGKQLHFWGTTLAACKNGRVHICSTERLEGDESLLDYLNREYQTLDGNRFLKPIKCIMDAGDGQVTLKVYDICGKYPGIFPCDGKSKINPIVWVNIDSRRVWGNRVTLATSVRQAHINGSTFKDQFWSFVKNKNITFAANLNEDTYKHYCAEKQILVKTENGSKYKWVPIYEGAANHLFDSIVYGLALLHDEKGVIAMEEYENFGSGEVKLYKTYVEQMDPRTTQGDF